MDKTMAALRARRWLIYNLRRKVWWRDQQAGYTEDVEEAGRYTDAEALAIIERMNSFWSPDGAGDYVMAVPVESKRICVLRGEAS